MALQKRAAEPFQRRAPGTPSYATVGGAPGAGAGPDEAPDTMPSSWGPARRGSFFLGMVSGGPSLLMSGLWVVDCCGLEGALKGAHRIPLFTWDHDDSPASWHLENVVSVVSDCHELGQCWIPEDGIVRQADVRDVEVDELGAVVLALPEGDR